MPRIRAVYLFADLVSRSWILALTRVWYETAKGLCFFGQEEKMDRRKKNFVEDQISLTSGTACLLRLPGQVLSTEPVLFSPCLAFAVCVSQMAVLHLSFA
jgi:hypothetical protein